MLLGITLSSDKTNISIMSGNRMAHPLLISLANIDVDIRSKGSLHTHLLLALLPVTSFIHKKSWVHSLLSNRLFHKCLDIVLGRLKVAAAIRIMMSDPVDNLRYCYTPLSWVHYRHPRAKLSLVHKPKSLPVFVLLLGPWKISMRYAWSAIQMTMTILSSLWRLMGLTALMRLSGSTGHCWIQRDFSSQNPFTTSTGFFSTTICSGASLL